MEINKTTLSDNTISLRKVAVISGIGYLVIFITGILSNFFVLEALVVPGDAAATAANIADGDMQFRLGILGFLIMVIFDVLLVWSLYELLKPANKSLSLLAALLRLVNGTIFGVALYHLFDVLQLLSSSAYLSIFEPGQIHAQIMLSISAFNYTWLIGLVFFGLHLLVLGYLIVKADYIPKILGILLIAAAAGYIVDSFAHFLLSNYNDYKSIFTMIVVIPGIIGELSFTLWLLIRGWKIADY
jgi:hypothetical protein